MLSAAQRFWQALSLPAVWRATKTQDVDLKKNVDLEKALAAIEDKIDGRLGVDVSDPVTGVNAAPRGDERFSVCSTYKLLAVPAVLHRVDEGEGMLSHEISRSLGMRSSPTRPPPRNIRAEP